MKLLSKRQVRELVLYSFAHIDRLEKAGKFPKRVTLGPNRVGWIEQEILDARQMVRSATFWVALFSASPFFVKTCHALSLAGPSRLLSAAMPLVTNTAQLTSNFLARVR